MRKPSDPRTRKDGEGSGERYVIPALDIYSPDQEGLTEISQNQVGPTISHRGFPFPSPAEVAEVESRLVGLGFITAVTGRQRRAGKPQSVTRPGNPSGAY